MIQLGVNIDHVATVREARGGNLPSVLGAAQAIERIGADSITVHLREDRRHIQDNDVLLLRRLVHIPLNLEMALSKAIIQFALNVVPDQITLVPEKRQELTTEGGLNVLANARKIEQALTKFRKKGISVSLFINPTITQIKKSVSLGVDAVELHTGQYADAQSAKSRTYHLQKLMSAAQLAGDLGLHVHAGHGLNYENVQAVCHLPYIKELNIGHSIVAQSLFVGLPKAVQDMKRIIKHEASICQLRKSKKK